jgi:hypothetical protein
MVHYKDLTQNIAFSQDKLWPRVSWIDFSDPNKDNSSSDTIQYKVKLFKFLRSSIAKMCRPVDFVKILKSTHRRTREHKRAHSGSPLLQATFWYRVMSRCYSRKVCHTHCWRAIIFLCGSGSVSYTYTIFKMIKTWNQYNIKFFSVLLLRSYICKINNYFYLVIFYMYNNVEYKFWSRNLKCCGSLQLRLRNASKSISCIFISLFNFFLFLYIFYTEKRVFFLPRREE